MHEEKLIEKPEAEEEDFQTKNPKITSAITRKTFKVLTYNTFLMPPGLRTREDNYKSERFALL